MKSEKLSLWVTTIGGLGLVFLWHYTAYSHPHSAEPIQHATTPDCMPLYIPRGTPRGRIATAKRTLEKDLPTVAVLAPESTGLTMREQPELYWYLSALTTHPIEFTISRRRAISPLLQTRLASPHHPGIQRIQLTDHGKHLEPNNTYTWSVALILDPQTPSKNLVATGSIEVESEELLQRELAKVSGPDQRRLMERVELLKQFRLEMARSSKALHPHLYARTGLWYDALSSISDLITSAPQNRDFRQQRAFLLEQVGMPKEVTTSDLRPHKE